MSVALAVIGTGVIGTDHVRRLHRQVPGADVAVVTDIDLDLARAVAATYGVPEAHTDGFAAIRSAQVDAVVVASSAASHAELVLAAVEAGKPVFCEKPLATTAEACLRIVTAEAAAGRRLVQVGFMRRYDEAYRGLKRTLDSGDLGAALLAHCVHRNPAVPGSFTNEMMINEAAIHEIDLVRWLLGEEITDVSVVWPRRNGHAAATLQDPMLVWLRTTGGVVVDVEVNVNVGYGYDIRTELVGERGGAWLSVGNAGVSSVGTAAWVPATWLERFRAAYDAELTEWVRAVVTGTDPQGPTAYDGYAAAVVADACVAAFGRDGWHPVPPLHPQEGRSGRHGRPSFIPQGGVHEPGPAPY
ncbi:Gfo/Idh/MocA family oxidoreductase [Dactylosporangium sp. CA-152071]|uniref:Gfo/Idh/MocA family oxidoreductase n=1 Tax=Dactylosporangium sp. CA-152071 TaxID=3239933 RepID=UPI003D8B81D6